MVNPFPIIALGIVFVFYILSIPAMVTAIDTSDGSQLENESVAVKTIYNNLPTLLLVPPFLIIGFAIFGAFKGGFN